MAGFARISFNLSPRITLALSSNSDRSSLKQIQSSRMAVSAVDAVADTSSFGGFVDSGFNQIRQNAGRSMAVLIRMLEALETIGTQASTHEQRQALEQHAALVLQAGHSHNPPEPDRMDLERAHASALQVIHSGRAY